MNYLHHPANRADGGRTPLTVEDAVADRVIFPNEFSGFLIDGNDCRRFLRWNICVAFVLAVGSVPAADKNAGDKALIGRWDLTIKDANGKELPSWLEVSQEYETWRARFVGRWGHARFLPTVTVTGKTIQFVSPQEEEGSKSDLIFDGKLQGKTLSGTAQGPDGTPWTWTGKRAPALKPPIRVIWREPVTLFNGRDHSGWHFDNPEKASSWRVENGCLVNKEAGSNIATDRKFTDFKLHVEVNCPSNANSGIYLRGSPQGWSVD